ncbi:ribonucleoprotein associated TUDOR protein [Phytophthora cinnamomi]|uniref:ribonucleoprotein associated TUDOR protein n=1 Tax=Phytophthora cinnamomi TaxID=4785 RepID=UPI003559CFC4|nr:ribonucleoprotein associated TUDOR protein [Phytophthora cinnamomi]
MASSSSECSTAFEGSVVSASAASEQYDDDDFDDYSDSFESEDDGAGSDATESAAAATSREADLALLRVGVRVQVFWIEENEWFNGLIQRVEEGNEPRYFVHYDDGEQAWEGPAKIRPLPATHTSADQYDQVQQLLPLSERSARATVGRRAIVYWPDEAEWFDGVVSSAQASPAALEIKYDDGDSRWEQEHAFNCILLLRSTVEAVEAPKTIPGLVAAPLSPPERVLYARPYREVVSDHFQPSVRIPAFAYTVS